MQVPPNSNGHVTPVTLEMIKLVNGRLFSHSTVLEIEEALDACVKLEMQTQASAVKCPQQEWRLLSLQFNVLI